MKILFLTSSFPYPPTDGVKNTTYNLFRQLSKRHKIFLLSFYTTPSEINEQNILQVAKYCEILGLLPIKRKGSILFRGLKNIFGKEPSFCGDFRSRLFEEVIFDFGKNQKADILHLDTINMSSYAEAIDGLMPKIASFYDSISLALRDEIIFFPYEGILKKFYRFLEFLNVRKYERRIYPRFDKCYVTSYLDRAYLFGLNAKIDAQVIPVGIDTEYFKPMDLPEEDATLCFTGALGGGNENYALWFIRNVLPRIRKVLPEVKLYIVGKNPGARFLKTVYKDKNIIVTGFVEDIRPYIQKATVSVSPVLKSCGILTKVLEAMSMAKVVVGTKFSFGGIRGAVSGENAIAVESPREFSRWIIRLIKEKELREALGRKARILVEGCYRYEDIAGKVELLYKQAIAKFNNI